MNLRVLGLVAAACVLNGCDKSGVERYKLVASARDTYRLDTQSGRIDVVTDAGLACLTCSATNWVSLGSHNVQACTNVVHLFGKYESGRAVWMLRSFDPVWWRSLDLRVVGRDYVQLCNVRLEGGIPDADGGVRWAGDFLCPQPKFEEAKHWWVSVVDQPPDHHTP